MKKYINDYDKKIEKVELLLLDDQKLNKYIEKLEDSSLDVPKGLEKNILYKIDEEGKKDVKKFKIQDILKIAACTVVALLIWQFSFSKQIAYASDYSVRYKRDEVYEKIDKTMDNIKNFFLEPISLKGDK